MYKKYEILKLLVSFCQFVNLQIVRTKTFIRKRRRRLLTLVTVNDYTTDIFKLVLYLHVIIW
jgi:hypothetical protein